MKAPFTLGKIYSDKLQNLVSICPYRFNSFRRKMEIGNNPNENLKYAEKGR